jgi:hypothetical protein
MRSYRLPVVCVCAASGDDTCVTQDCSVLVTELDLPVCSVAVAESVTSSAVKSTGVVDKEFEC